MFENYIILSDLDGTLLNSKSEVSDENLKAINYFIENGGKFGVATGRSYKNAMKYIEKLPTNSYSIFLNGSVLYDNGSKEYVRTHYLDKNKVVKFLRKILESKKVIAIEISTLDKTYFVNNFNSVFEKEVINQSPYEMGNLEEIFKLDWLKVLLFFYDKDDYQWLNENSQFLEEEEVCTRVLSGERYFELLPYNVSKGSMLDEIRDLQNNNCKIIAVGDYYNDLEMVRRADIGVFTSMASEDLQKEANYITVDCNSHVLKDIIYNDSLFKRE